MSFETTKAGSYGVTKYWTNARGQRVEVGRANRKFHTVLFTFLSKDRCIGDITFSVGKDFEKHFYTVEGHPARVLNEILSMCKMDEKSLALKVYEEKKLEYMLLNAKEFTLNEADGWIYNEHFKNLAKDVIAESRQKFKAINKSQALEREKQQLEEKLIAAKASNEKVDLDRIKPLLNDVQKTISEANKVTQELKDYVRSPNAFKSYATKEVINLGIYESLTPAEILTQRIQLTNTSIPELAKAIGLDVSTVYKHVQGERDVDRKQALRYASFFGCDPSDILFPPVKIPVSGEVDFLKPLEQGSVKFYDKKTSRESILCPRDFYSKIDDIKAIQVNSKGSVYDNHTLFYYYTNEKQNNCENKICFIVCEPEKGPFSDIFEEDIKEEKKEPHWFEQDVKKLDQNFYYVGIYENHRGKIKILNPDPYRQSEVISENPNIKFITPIIGVVNSQIVKFSPVKERNFKKLSENEKLQTLEKELEIAEQAWFVEQIKFKQEPRAFNGPTAQRKFHKQYSDLKQLRLKVQKMRYDLMPKEEIPNLDDLTFGKDDQKWNEKELA